LSWDRRLGLPVFALSRSRGRRRRRRRSKRQDVNCRSRRRNGSCRSRAANKSRRSSRGSNSSDRGAKKKDRSSPHLKVRPNQYHRRRKSPESRKRICRFLALQPQRGSF